MSLSLQAEFLPLSLSPPELPSILLPSLLPSLSSEPSTSSQLSTSSSWSQSLIPSTSSHLLTPSLSSAPMSYAPTSSALTASAFKPDLLVTTSLLTAPPTPTSSMPPSSSNSPQFLSTYPESLPSTMCYITSIPSINPVLCTPPNSATTTISLEITSTAVSSPVSSTDSPQLPSAIADIVGGTVGAVTLLALLIFIVVRCRSKHSLSVTPFILPSTAGPTQVESHARLMSQSTSGAVRPSSRVPSTIQYSDAYLEEYSWNLPLSDVSRVDQSSSYLPDDYDASASTIARLERACELEKLYPTAYPSRVRTTDHYCHHSGENWVDQMVSEDYSREPSEELPAYPCSTKSLKSREAGHDGFPSSNPKRHR